MPHSIGSATWHYTMHGTGETLLFIHGWGGNHRLWQAQTVYFGQHYKVIVLDLPGHGKTVWQPFSVEEMARQLNILLDQLEITSVTAVASSMGGLIVLKLYELFPERFKRMVFVGALPKFLQTDDFPFGLAGERIEKLSRQLETDYPEIVAIFFRSLFTKKERALGRFKWLEQFGQSDDLPQKEALKDFLQILMKEDLRKIIPTIKIPVQIINGTEDYICSLQAVNYWKSQLPTVDVELFKECGHFPFISYQKDFNERLETFLKKIPIYTPEA